MLTRNPFPGMNPFLEGSWPDVHTALIGFVRECLAEQLPDDLTARAEEEVSISRDGGPESYYRADVAVNAVWPPGLPEVARPTTGEAMAIAEPVVVELDHPTARWVEIRDTHGQLITVIEVLSPANKTGVGRVVYLQKQQDYLAAGVNLVEIDLLRGGQPAFFDDDLNRLAPTAGTRYLVTATGAGPPAHREVYYCVLRERLPAVRVPLRAADADAALDLQSLIDRVYRTGRYWHVLHRAVPGPPLPAADADWVAEIVRGAAAPD